MTNKITSLNNFRVITEIKMCYRKNAWTAFFLLGKCLYSHYLFYSQYIKHETQCFTTLREESSKYDTQRSTFDKRRGVWKCGQTVS